MPIAADELNSIPKLKFDPSFLARPDHSIIYNFVN
jgi:hypothetical protein